MTTSPPFADGLKKLVQITDAPLRRVMGVLNFAPILAINDMSQIAKFQNGIRSTYPDYRSQPLHLIEFNIGENGEARQPELKTQHAHVFDGGDGGWQITLTSHSIAVETVNGYAGRTGLLDRFVAAVTALRNCFAPIEDRRLGFRFLNFFEGDNLNRLPDYIRSEPTSFIKTDFRDAVKSSYAQVELETAGGMLLVKYGLLAQGAMTDFMIEPRSETAWMLDIDSSRVISGDIGEPEFRAIATELTDQACGFFRWSVTDVFVEERTNG